MDTVPEKKKYPSSIDKINKKYAAVILLTI